MHALPPCQFPQQTEFSFCLGAYTARWIIKEAAINALLSLGNVCGSRIFGCKSLQNKTRVEFLSAQLMKMVALGWRPE